jgi:GNAT superfamily N-acetyltransferase
MPGQGRLRCPAMAQRAGRYESWRHGGYEISTDPARLDLDVIHGFLQSAYWCYGIPRRVLERSIDHSLPFGLFGPEGEQAGFARVISDHAQFAYLCDVFVLPKQRGRGLGAWLVQCILEHPELQGLRRWALVTADAHELYARFGFRPLKHPRRHMVIERSPDEVWPSQAKGA